MFKKDDPEMATECLDQLLLLEEMNCVSDNGVKTGNYSVGHQKTAHKINLISIYQFCLEASIHHPHGNIISCVKKM